MAGRIESTDQLRKVLETRGLLSVVKRLDMKDRADNQAYRKRLEGKYRSRKAKKPVCAYCGDHDRSLYVSHIEPVEIGGPTTENNLVLLCKSCHGAFDKGAVSISEMKKIAERWTCRRRRSLEESSSVPEMTKPPAALRKFVCDIRKMERERSGQAGVRQIATRLRDTGLKKAHRTYLGILQAEMIRRGAGRKAIDKAMNKLETVPLSEVPPECRGYYCYERGYLLRLAGRHNQACCWMKQGAREARRRTGAHRAGVDYVAASVNVILCEVASQSRITPQKAKGLLRRIDQLASVARKNGGYWGGRWELNCAVQTLQVHIRADHKRGSWKALNKMVKTFEGYDATTGWGEADRQTISLLRGVVHARFHRNCAELADGVRLLARSFMSRIKDNRQKPEGIRDVGIELARALARYTRGDAERIRVARQLEDVITKVVDGTSVLWPQRDV